MRVSRSRLTADRSLLQWRAHERQGWERGLLQIAGVDEAGRGPLAGPVVAAACIIPPDLFIEGIDDSKRLTRTKRMALFEELRSHAQILIGVGVVDVLTIDSINILQATIRAMQLALGELSIVPDQGLVDGYPIPHPTIPIQGIVGGDGLCYPIAAASIIAKETRDRLMEEYHQQWPQYGFDAHKGYGTPAHLEAINRYGFCPLHRRSFNKGRR